MRTLIGYAALGYWKWKAKSPQARLAAGTKALFLVFLPVVLLIKAC